MVAIIILTAFCILAVFSECATYFRLYRSNTIYKKIIPLVVPLTVCAFLVFIARINAKNAVGSACKLCLAAAFVIILILVTPDLVYRFGNKTAIRNAISAYGIFAVPAFIVFQILQVVILPVPGIVSIGAGACLFGSFFGGLYSFIGITVGSFIAFYIGRKAGRKAVAFLCGNGYEKLFSKFTGREYFLSVMFILPFFPDDLLCFVAGMSSMSLKYFAAVMIFSRLISSFAAAYFIDGVPVNTPSGIILWLAAILLFLAAAILIKKRFRKTEG